WDLSKQDDPLFALRQCPQGVEGAVPVCEAEAGRAHRAAQIGGKSSQLRGVAPVRRIASLDFDQLAAHPSGVLGDQAALANPAPASEGGDGQRISNKLL